MTEPTAPAGEHLSLWLATTARTGYGTLPAEMHVDVAVAGGGIAGLTAAWLLRRQGLRVAVLEAGRIAEATTGHTTAKLTSQHGLIYDYLTTTYGAETAARYAAANEAAIDLVEAIVQEHGIACDFARTPAYVYTQDEGEVGQIEAEAEAAQRAGLPASVVTETPLPFPVKAALRFDRQARFHPRKYLLALAELFVAAGGQIVEGVRAQDVEQGEPCRVTTDRGVLVARDVIMATHFPFHDNGLYFARMKPGMSYLMAATLDGPVPEGMFIDVAAQHTLRRHVEEGQEMLIVGGEGHTTGQESDAAGRYGRIESFARTHFPVRAFLYRWATQDFTPFDRVPFIGRSNPTSRHLYVATGFMKWGMTTGTVAGMLLTDLIAGRENPWTGVFDPNRVELAGITRLVQGNLQVGKEFLTGRLGSDEARPLPAGEGQVIDTPQGKVAVYRDEEGSERRLSAVCPHMKCIVAWNADEKTWDCPCHASRFDVDGRVLDGPALSPLAPAPHPS